MRKSRFFAVLAALCLTVGLLPAAWAAEETGEEHSLALSDSAVTLDGTPLTEGQEGAVTLSRDIVYYEDRDTYDSGNPYGEGTQGDKHTAQEAAAHLVVTIREKGTYRVSGALSQGQLAVDLGEEAKTDPEAVVTLILDGVDITCAVAPGVIFYNVYECDAAWVAYDDDETGQVTYTPSGDQDLSGAGARVVLADGSVNNVRGAYVAKIYKDNGKSKKLHKYDGAFYSKMSMTVDGEEAGSGVLNITAQNEGLDSELHLELLGGKVNIASQDDGINTNEDGVSATILSGGSLHIVAGLGTEGDGIDSNGFLTINGGTVIAIANPRSDSGLDSDMGSVINGGWVVATGSTMDWPESDSDQVTMNLQFAAAQASDEAILVTDQEGKVVFAYDPDRDETTGTQNRGYQGAVLSCPEFQVGETYRVYVGGQVSGQEVDGLYDPATVTGFTGALRQQYTGTDVRRGPGGMGGWGQGLQRPDGIGEPPEGMPEPPEGTAQTPADGQTPPEMPDDQSRPSRPQGDFDPTQGGPQGGLQGDQGQPSVDFYMQDKVNFFSGLTDETVVYPTTHTVTVDGVPMEFQMYARKDANGYETNYIRIRDLAQALGFQVTWDPEGGIQIYTDQPYQDD